MAAARKKILGLASFERPRIRLADAADQAAPCAVHEQQGRIEAVFSEAQLTPYPAPVRLAILVGSPAAVWVGVIWAAAQVGRMI